MSYFTIPISAGSEEELKKRIRESEALGFELVKTYEEEGDYPKWGNSGYRVGGEAVFNHKGTDYSKRYRAVMRRCNKDYLNRRRESGGLKN